MLTKLSTVALFVLFNLCVTTSFAQVSKAAKHPISFRPQITQSGLIFGSLTFPQEKAAYNGYFLQIRSKSADKKVARSNFHELRFTPKQIWKMQHKGDLDNGLTYLFALDLPEGDYEISGIRLFTNSGIAALQRNDALSFSIPFTVSKGQIQYVGNILFNEHWNREPTAVIRHENNFEKDLAGIKVLQPYILWNTAEDNDLKMSFKKAE